MKTREIRFLLTNLCNFKCVHCHREGVIGNRNIVVTPSDITYIFDTAKSTFGWKTITLSGGEPLLFPEIIETCKLLYEKDAKITLVTNGSLLREKNCVGMYIDRLNISLNTSIPDIYSRINGCSYDLYKLIDNIYFMRCKYKDLNIRLNCTIINGFNDLYEDIVGIIKLAKEVNASVKLIELISKEEMQVYKINSVHGLLLKLGFQIYGASIIQRAYTDKETEVILSRSVCSIAKEAGKKKTCIDTNSIFILSSGVIKPCMKNDFEIDINKEIVNKNDSGLVCKINNSISLLKSLCPY
jgi:cyclic pyranopterin phosphate synthase